MDKYEYKVRSEEIKELIARKDYVQAAEIADTIDWRRVKSVMMLCTISDLYKMNRRYEDARDMLLLAYDRRPGGRTICYSLCELSIKMEEFVQAVEYYKEFVQVAPKDTGRYILQYKLYEAQDVSLEERISVLEELKKRDYREKWAYELAYLYHRVGLGTRCVEECDELILWFGEGKYVVKAMELKMLHEPLTPAQQEKYNHRFRTSEVETVPESEFAESEAEVGDETENEEQVVQSIEDTRVYEPVYRERIPQDESTDEKELDIHVKTMDVGQYNTINLQAELAEGLKEVLSENDINPITRAIMAPMLESDTESLDYPQIEEVNEDDLESAEEEIEKSEVFFGETAELETVGQEEAPKPVEEKNGEPVTDNQVPDVTAEIVMEQMRQEETGQVRDVMWNAEPPKELVNVLSQESDGQISLVMPEKEIVEKQITGQMSIADIFAEWERMKKENQEKREEEVRKHVQQQTGAMFTEFEAAVRDSLLEHLERGKAEVSELPEDLNDEAEEPAEGPAKEEADEEPEAEEPVKEAAVEESEAEEPVEEFVEEVVEESAEEPVVEEPAKETVAEEPAAEEPVKEAVAEEPEAEEPAKEAVVEEPAAEEPVKEAKGEESVTKEPGVDSTEEVPEVADDETEEIVWEIGGEGAEESKETVEEAVEQPVVEPEKAKIRSLTREERELYAPYVQSRRAREQLVQAVDHISLAAYTGNIIITGAEGMDILTLAKNMIREVQLEDSNFSGKVAKVSGAALNQKDIAEVIRELKNGALIIQKASDMSEESAATLNKTLQQESMGIIVVLLDTKKVMNRFLAKNAELHKCFTARVDVEALSNDTLVAFGRQYAREMEYAIDDMGILALHTKIANRQTSDHIVTVVEVKKIVDEAIRRASRITIGHFFDILFAKRYDEEDMIILSEKDFI